MKEAPTVVKHAQPGVIKERETHRQQESVGAESERGSRTREGGKKGSVKAEG